MAEFRVSRTVGRKTISRLAAGGRVETRHGMSTFLVGDADAAAIPLGDADSMAVLRDVVAVMELRLSVEPEAAAMAAIRRSDAGMEELRKAYVDFVRAMERGDAIAPDILRSRTRRTTHISWS